MVTSKVPGIPLQSKPLCCLGLIDKLGSFLCVFLVRAGHLVRKPGHPIVDSHEINEEVFSLISNTEHSGTGKLNVSNTKRKFEQT